jgi:hypothetical protein
LSRQEPQQLHLKLANIVKFYLVVVLLELLVEGLGPVGGHVDDHVLLVDVDGHVDGALVAVDALGKVLEVLVEAAVHAGDVPEGLLLHAHHEVVVVEVEVGARLVVVVEEGGRGGRRLAPLLRPVAATCLRRISIK